MPKKTIFKQGLDVRGDIDVSGSIEVGTDATDTVTFLASVNSGVIPTDNKVQSLGSISKRWNDFFVKAIDVDEGIELNSSQLTGAPDPVDSDNVVNLNYFDTNVGVLKRENQVLTNTNRTITVNTVTLNSNTTVYYGAAGYLRLLSPDYYTIQSTTQIDLDFSPTPNDHIAFVNYDIVP